MRAIVGAAALLPALIAPAHADAVREQLAIDSTALGKPVRVPLTLLIPEGAQGRVPAMLIVHGSGGVRENREYAYAYEFLKLGVAGAIQDSFGARGIGSTVNDQAAVPSADMIGDAVRSLQALAKHPRIDPQRIGVIGFSKGGTVALQTAIERTMRRYSREPARFALHVAMYPGCDTQFFNVKSTGAPIRVFIGGEDSYVGSKPCLDYAAKFKEQGADIDAKVFRDAQHDFDVPGDVWRVAGGENYAKCRFMEQADGSWVEQTSGLKTHDTAGKPLPARAEALKACKSHGVSGAYDRSATRQSMADIQAAIKAAFKLN